MLGKRFFENVIQDTRYGLRTLTRNPVLVLVAALSLGFGIGTNTAVFNLLQSVLLKNVSAVEPDRLVKIKVGDSNMVSYPNYRDLRDSNVFAGMIAHSNNLHSGINWRTGDETRSLYCQIVSSNFFSVLGVQAARGRTFTDEEARPEANPNLAVLSNGFWTSSLGSDPEVIGRTLTLNGRPFTVVGVLAKDYRSVAGVGLNPDMYVPISDQILPGLEDRSLALFELIGRFATDGSPAQAKTALAGVAQSLEATYPEPNKDFGKSVDFRPMSGLDWLRRANEESIGLPVLEISGVLLAVVAMVLLVACANIANLLLARGSSRRQEIAVRIAVGAGRGRLIQQLLIETLLLSLIATGLGLLLNYWFIQLLSQVTLPLPLPFELKLQIDWSILLYSLLLVVVTTILCGLIPALRSTKIALVPALKAEQPHLIHRRFTFRNFLVVAQVSVSVVLMVGASLFIRNMQRINSINPGFDAKQTLSADIALASDRYTSEGRMEYIEKALNRLNATPGIELASCANFPPLSLNDWGVNVRLEGAPETERFRVNIQLVGSKYFKTMGIPMLSGRDFDESYATGSPLVVIVNQTFAQRYFQGGNPVGAQLMAGKRALQIIGLVQDSKYRSLGEDPTPLVYQCYQQLGLLLGGDYFSFLARTAGPPNQMSRVVKNVLGELDPSAALEVSTMEERLEPMIFPSKVGAALLGGLAAVGLALALVGLYGVMAYAISQRTFEIGVRMALGATQGRILRMVMKDGLVLIAAGLVVGVIVSLIVTRLLGRLIVAGISTSDPLSFAAVVLLYGIVGLGTSLLVARKATLVDPIRTLRGQ
jgi:predicted permease